MEKQKLLTTIEAAEILGVHQSRIYALIKAKRLPATRFGKSWIIQETDLKLVKERSPGRPKKAGTKS
jgi:excisionase family DNA binding protein